MFFFLVLTVLPDFLHMISMVFHLQFLSSSIASLWCTSCSSFVCGFTAVYPVFFHNPLYRFCDLHDDIVTMSVIVLGVFCPSVFF